LSVDALAQRLTMAGLEVDGIAPAAKPMSGIFVAKVLDVTPHPDADRLACCSVDVGLESPVDVVCGAPNVRAGLTVAYAAPGASLPDGRTITNAVVRGVSSAGMLCSAAELALSDDASGLIELADDGPVGALLGDYLELDDVVLDIDLTPNRGDCLSILGVAREVAVLSNRALAEIVVEPISASVEVRLAIDIEQRQSCPRYAGRVIKSVNAAAPTPQNIKERLRRAGVRSISAIVDVTNYVMLELGQPMHGFDLARLSGGIIVRNGTDGETLELLDGQNIELTADTLVIADHDKAVALAGVMGGAATGVELTSTDIFLESAYFDPITLAGVARRYRLHTDASHRFERGVDFSGQERAIERATAMILDICGGEAGPTVVAQEKSALPRREPIRFRPSEVSRLIGIEVSAAQATQYLQYLGCDITKSEEELSVIAPNFRFDLEIEADILEEIARLVGYDNIPASLPSAGMNLQAVENTHEQYEQIRQTLITQGYFEAVTYSFIDSESDHFVEPTRSPQILSNPISADMSTMRTSMWPGLIRAAHYNLNRQAENVRFFELGMIFERTDDGLDQRHVLSGISLGELVPEQWGEASRKIDYYDVKQDVIKVMQSLKLANFSTLASSDAALHPGQSAALLLGGDPIGKIGVLHPRTARYFDLEKTAVVFEIELDILPSGRLPAFSPISKFPSVRRDISLVLPEGVSAANVLGSVQQAAGDLLRDLQLFDEYRGQGIDSDKKSLTIGLIFQSLSSTLTDEEIEETMKRVLLQVHDDFGGTLRK
jgi:phenylalanyl-tRNA synthetase beta chain